MEHPRLFSDDDPLVATIRAECLRLPEAVEILSHGRPAFKAGEHGRVFALVGSTMARPDSLVFKPDPAEAPALREDPSFFIPPYWGASGWLGLDLVRGEPLDERTRELIETSYRQVALQRQLAVLDAVM